MNSNHISKTSLEALLTGRPVEGGILYNNEIIVEKLDFSLKSLKYIDDLIDVIRDRYNHSENEISNQGLQNLIYVMGFYVGEVIARARNENAIWMTFEELGKHDIKLANMAGGGFWCSISVRYGDTVFLPLNSITTRLFEGPEEKSVYYSSMGFVNKPVNGKKWYQFWK